MKKLILIPIISSLAFFANVTHGQFLPPPHPDTVGLLELDFEGGAIAGGGSLQGGLIIFDGFADFDDINPYAPYAWCFEVGIGYEYESTLGDGDGFYYNSWELGQATPDAVLTSLFSAPPPAGPPTFADLLALYNGIPGLVDAVWPSPLGLAAEDVLFFLDPDGLVLLFESDDLDFGIVGTLDFEGSARLSLKSLEGGAVPEPSTYGIIGAGFLIVLVALRKKKMAARS